MFHTASEVDAAFNARFPGKTPGVIGSLAASGEPAGSIQAAGVVGYEEQTNELVWIRVVGPHGISARGKYIAPDDLVQMKKGEANLQVSLGRAEFATDAEVAAALKKASK